MSDMLRITLAFTVFSALGGCSAMNQADRGVCEEVSRFSVEDVPVSCIERNVKDGIPESEIQALLDTVETECGWKLLAFVSKYNSARLVFDTACGDCSSGLIDVAIEVLDESLLEVGAAYTELIDCLGCIRLDTPE